MGFTLDRDSHRVRVFLSLFVLFLLSAFLITAMPGGALAQEPPKDAKEGKDAKKKVDVEISLAQMAMYIMHSTGIVFGAILLIVSISLVTLIVLLAIDLRLSVAVPGNFVDEFTDMVNKRQFKGAFELCRSNDSFIARVLTAGMGRLQYGIEDAREACFNMVDSVRAGKDNFVTYLGTIGTLGPMLGLVGTVWGMIKSFYVLALLDTPSPQELADGISHALAVTLVGVAISVPAIFFFSFFKNRLVRVSMDTSNLADDLLTQMYHNSKKAGAQEAEPPSAKPAVPVAKPAGPPSSSGITQQRPKSDK